MRNSKIWTQEEDKRLQNNYQLKRNELIKLFPNRTPASINIRASILGLKKERNEYIDGKLDILLNEEFESYYWIGFILADGCINRNRLTIGLSIKDYEHLNNFSKYIMCNNLRLSKNKLQCWIAIQDKYVVPKIKQKFDFKQSKTYNPPDIIPSDFDKLISLFVGFIDGDGTIGKQTGRTDSILRIQVHASWINWLIKIHNKIENKLNIKTPLPKINKRGYCSWCISNSVILSFLKKEVINKKLPILNRKWDNIDENFVSKYEITKKNILEIKLMKSQGYKNKDIANILNISKACVSILSRKESVI